MQEKACATMKSPTFPVKNIPDTPDTQIDTPARCSRVPVVGVARGVVGPEVLARLPVGEAGAAAEPRLACLYPQHLHLACGLCALLAELRSSLSGPQVLSAAAPASRCRAD